MKARLGSGSIPPAQAGLLLVISVALLLLPSHWQDTSRMYLATPLRPFQSVALAGTRGGLSWLETALDRVWAFLGGRRRDAEAASVRALRKRIEELERRFAHQEELLQEARAKLDNLTGEYPLVPQEVAIADVIAHDSSDWRKSVIVDKGSKAGVRVGMIAYWNGALVGRVSATGPYCSRVRLVTEPSSRVSVRSARSRAIGVLEGTGRGGCRMKYVGPDDDVRVGDRIVTAGTDGVFPPHLPVGECARSDRASGEIQRNVLVNPLISPRQLESVVIAAWQPPDARLGPEGGP
jgi:rod shape-determining protein MreC